MHYRLSSVISYFAKLSLSLSLSVVTYFLHLIYQSTFHVSAPKMLLSFLVFKSKEEEGHAVFVIANRLKKGCIERLAGLSSPKVKMQMGRYFSRDPMFLTRQITGRNVTVLQSRSGLLADP